MEILIDEKYNKDVHTDNLSIETRYRKDFGSWAVSVFKNTKDGSEHLGNDYGLLTRDYAIASGKRIISACNV